MLRGFVDGVCRNTIHVSNRKSAFDAKRKRCSGPIIHASTCCGAMFVNEKL